MRELQLAVEPSYDPARPPAEGRKAFSLPRAAFFASIAAHAVGGYALTLQKWAGPASPNPTADVFLFERPAPRAAEAVPVEIPPEVEEPLPPPRVAEGVPESAVVVEPVPVREPVPVGEPAPVEETAPEAQEAFIDFDEERRRAANEVVEERTARQYMTFSLDDVVPPRPAPEPPPPPSIFEGGGGDFGGRSVATVGQQRTKFGRKLAEFCNALGGFGVGFQGFGLFSACASPESGLSGFLPEVRPDYLDLMPECVDTRDTAPALALEAPFPTVKCRLVEQKDVEQQP